MYLRGKIAVAMGVIALVVTACGDSDSDNGSAGGSSAKMSASAQAEVRKTVEQHLKRPTSLGLSGAVKSIPKGKTLYYIHSATPVSTITANSGKKAVRAVGWTFKGQSVKPTPEGFQQGFNNALNDPNTDAIISTAVPTSAIAKYLKRAESRKIPVAILHPDNEGGGNLFAIGGPQGYRYAGQLEADYILDKTKGDARVILALPAAFPTINMLADGFKKEWAAKCPKCKEPLVYEAPLTSFGTTFPRLLTAYLQAHRDVDYIVFGFNDMMSGVPTALKAAGLNQVKAITWAQGPQSNALLGKGLLEAQVGVPTVEFPWVALDALLRHFNNQPTTTNKNFLSAGHEIHWIITKENMEAAGLDPGEIWPLNPNYAQELKQLWGVDN